MGEGLPAWNRASEELLRDRRRPSCPTLLMQRCPDPSCRVEDGRPRVARLIVNRGWGTPGPLSPSVSLRNRQSRADRYETKGLAGMFDRSSTPHHQPNPTPAPVAAPNGEPALGSNASDRSNRRPDRGADLHRVRRPSPVPARPSHLRHPLRVNRSKLHPRRAGQHAPHRRQEARPGARRRRPEPPGPTAGTHSSTTAPASRTSRPVTTEPKRQPRRHYATPSRFSPTAASLCNGC